LYVADASVWVARFWMDDPRHDDALAWVTNIVLGESHMFAPTILLAEVAGSMVRRTGDVSEGQNVIRTLQDLSNRGSISFRDVDMELGVSSADIAMRLRLRGMDAIYVATAQHTNSTLVTLDNEQRERASQVVSAIVPPRQT